MPIVVVCPGCKTEFRVSDQYAGKTGKCPKCKGQITVPAVEEVKIVEPEPPPTAKKDAQGRPVSRPIEREKTKLRLVPALLAGGSGLLIVAGAWLGGPLLREQGALRALGLLLLSPPLTVVGYWFLRDAELEAYRGATLWLRALICGLAFAALWGIYAVLPEAWTPRESWGWFLVAPPFLVVGAGISLAAFDLDFGSGFLHYVFYVLVTGALRAVAGMPALWAVALGW